MKNKITKCLATLAVAASLVTVTSVAQAYYGGNPGNRYVCKWVPGHWKHGYWVQGTKVCWWKKTYNRGCIWRPGHWYHGYWVPPTKVCW